MIKFIFHALCGSETDGIYYQEGLLPENLLKDKNK